MRWFGSLGRYVQYTSYVVKHKVFVFQAAWKMRLPWRVLLVCALHDNSKFLPFEFSTYAKHFYLPDGTKRTTLAKDGFYKDVPDDAAFDRAWLRHIQRNKHHPQHWVITVAMACDCPQDQPARTDVLLCDDGYARCTTCRAKKPLANVLHVVFEMPEPYLSEMLCDWIGAGMAQGTPDVLSWYTARGRHHLFGPKTRAEVERRLGYEDIP
jgi:hypothetical protein